MSVDRLPPGPAPVDETPYQLAEPLLARYAEAAAQDPAQLRIASARETIDKGNLLGRWQDQLAVIAQSVDQAEQNGGLTEHDETYSKGYLMGVAGCLADLDQLLPRFLDDRDLPEPPREWRCVGHFGPAALRYSRRWRGQNWKVIVDVRRQLDGRRWAHVSVSRPDRCPTWDEMAEIKRDFLGDLGAIQVAPPQADHVDLHKTCLHWWAPLDAWPLPSFSWGGDSI